MEPGGIPGTQPGMLAITAILLGLILVGAQSPLAAAIITGGLWWLWRRC